MIMSIAPMTIGNVMGSVRKRALRQTAEITSKKVREELMVEGSRLSP